jgi:hypothetical protein
VRSVDWTALTTRVDESVRRLRRLRRAVSSEPAPSSSREASRPRGLLPAHHALLQRALEAGLETLVPSEREALLDGCVEGLAAQRPGQARRLSGGLLAMHRRKDALSCAFVQRVMERLPKVCFREGSEAAWTLEYLQHVRQGREQEYLESLALAWLLSPLAANAARPRRLLEELLLTAPLACAKTPASGNGNADFEIEQRAVSALAVASSELGCPPTRMLEAIRLATEAADPTRVPFVLNLHEWLAERLGNSESGRLVEYGAQEWRNLARARERVVERHVRRIKDRLLSFAKKERTFLNIIIVADDSDRIRSRLATVSTLAADIVKIEVVCHPDSVGTLTRAGLSPRTDFRSNASLTTSCVIHVTCNWGVVTFPLPVDDHRFRHRNGSHSQYEIRSRPGAKPVVGRLTYRWQRSFEKHVAEFRDRSRRRAKY